MRVGLLGIEDLTRDQIQTILDRARDFQPKPDQGFRKLDLLRGRMVVNLFFEASTRTRTSFEIAAKCLGADSVSITAQASSVSKGESLVDTLNTLGRCGRMRSSCATRLPARRTFCKGTWRLRSSMRATGRMSIR